MTMGPRGIPGGRRTMYESRFGLRQRPFPATPDALFYYPATTHEQALQRLAQALDEGEGLALGTGAPGTGKTLLCHRLIERLRAGHARGLLAYQPPDSP